MIHEGRPWLVDFHAAATFGSFPVSGIRIFLLGLLMVVYASWDLSIVLKWFWCFLNLKVRVWGVSGVIGLGSLVPAFFFASYHPPPLSAGSGVVPFVCLFTFFFSVLPAPSLQSWARVWVIGPLN